MATKLQEASIKIRQNKNKDTSPKWVGIEEWTSAEFTLGSIKWHGDPLGAGDGLWLISYPFS